MNPLILCLPALLVLTSMAQTAQPDLISKPTPAKGPLQVHPQNPRYFTDGTTNVDGSLRAVYLGGHQIFVDLQDNAFNKEWIKDMSCPDDPARKARLLDWDRYVDFVARHQFNYVRGWIIWSTGSGKAASPHRIAHPMPFQRTGPEMANDGKPKFDLRRFDETFFQRLHDRARALQNRGVYLSVMLFELYGFLDGEAVDGQRLWEGNLFNRVNNVQSLDVDRNQNRLGEEFFSLGDLAVERIQKAYIEKIVDTLNDLDNVLWEICNEAPAAAVTWQYEMMRHLKAYEARKPKQHLVLLSPGGWTPGGWTLPPEEKFTESTADFIATANGWIDKDNPKVYSLRKPVMMDLDHVAPGDCSPVLIWKAFTRGYHFSLYETPFEQPQQESPAWQAARRNMGLTQVLASRVQDLARLVPQADMASTSYCLANAGKEYVVYSPTQEQFAVKGLLADRTYQFEWIDTAKGNVFEKGVITVQETTHRFRPPCAGAVLFLAIQNNAPASDTLRRGK